MGEEGNKTNDHGEALESALDLGTEREAGIDAEREEEEEDGDDGEEDGEEEEEEVEGGEDDIEDGEYTFRFKSGMNPLDFTEGDAFGVQPYQQFERLEYEALAEKKRKALANRPREGSAKKARQEDVSGASIDEIMEAMNYGGRRKSRKPKKRGRRKGSKNKLSPEVTRMLGDATLHYAHGCYKEAICVLNEVVRLAPNLSDPYHTLGLVYNAIGDRKKALNSYMLAAIFSPKDPYLWKLLVTWSIEQGNTGQAKYCLSKAISADPEDISLRFHHAALYVELGDYQKAAESYVQISQLCPENVEALKTGAKLFLKCGQVERSTSILEEYLRQHPTEADLSVVDLLAAMCMENNMHDNALRHIEHAHLVYCSGKDLPLYLTVKAGICHIHLGNMEKAKILFSVLQQESAYDHTDLITEVADSFMSLEHYDSALNYYLMLEGNDGDDNGFLKLKIAQCYLSLRERVQAISFFYKALSKLEDNIDARLALASLLLEEAKSEEAILLLSPPKDLESVFDPNSGKSNPWWLDGKVKLKLSNIYKAKGMLENFVDTIFPLVRESLFIESIQQKVKVRKRLSRSDLFERVKILDDGQTDNVFHGFRPVASASDLLKAARAKKLLQKKATLKEERKAAALAAGVDWQSDDSGQ
ncbi:hypothetical protein L1049_011535 [Liquidambar formosana]|uniref:General transcription factor 3C polypeptide 3 n=1 Tax=Liquidambar formosana TaxID=63359 RepID=A0AAP0X2B7_LIQFO